MAEVIVYVTGQNPLTGLGGGSNYVRAHARAAVKAQFEPHIFCSGRANEIIRTEFGFVHKVQSPWSKYAPVRAPSKNKTGTLLGGWLLSFAYSPYTVMLHGPSLQRSIEQFLLAQKPPHLIHSFYTWGAVSLKVQQSLRMRGIETIVINSFYTTVENESRVKLKNTGHWIHRGLFQAEALWNRWLIRKQEEYAYRKSQLVLVNYDSVRRMLNEEYGTVPRIRNLTYSPEIAFLNPQPGSLVEPDGSQNRPLILSVSRHDPRKGISVFIHALAQLRQAGYQFEARIVSGGPLLSSHQRLAQKLRLNDVVNFTGWVPDTQIHFNEADLFVLPSLEEGSGSIALLEALQKGIPCIASACDGIPEDITDEYDALLVPPGDPGKLATALRRLMDDSALRSKLAANARKTFENRFSAQRFSLELAQLYDELRPPRY